MQATIERLETEALDATIRIDNNALEIARLKCFETSFTEWLDKTEWVQDSMNAGTLFEKHLGRHRADIIKSLVIELTANRDEYQREADGMAAKHKVERDALAADIEVLLGHINTMQKCSNDPAIFNLATVVLERFKAKREAK